MNTSIQQVLLRSAAILVCAIAWPMAANSGPVTIALVPVGDVGNAADTTVMDDSTTGYGSLSYNYNISKYDVTYTQYAAFLNAVDSTGANSLGLYDSLDATSQMQGISRTGGSYVVKAGYANQPAAYVNWYSAARFTNWLTNGQGSGGTETGVYTLTGLTSVAALPASHSALVGTTGKKWFLPTENEWYKAAYYKGGNTNAGYWTYPFQSNTAPTLNQTPGGSNSSNFYNGVYAVTQSPSQFSVFDYFTDVGAYTSAKSPYGVFDMGGDVLQWNESLTDVSDRGLRGSNWNGFSSLMRDSFRSGAINPTNIGNGIGFRVAELPEPGSLTLFVLGAIGVWFASRRRRASRRSCAVPN